MSKFLSWGFISTAGGLTIDDLQILISNELVNAGWQLLNWVGGESAYHYAEFIPPVGQTIGDGKLHQRVRIYYVAFGSQVRIRIRGINYPDQDLASEMFAANTFAGINTPSLIFGGETAPFSITASLEFDVLTVTAADGVIMLGSPIYGDPIALSDSAIIVEFLTGTGGPGTYRIGNYVNTIPESTFSTMAVTVVEGAATVGGSEFENSQNLFNAIKNSTDPQVLAWNVHLTNPNLSGGIHKFIFERKYVYDSGAGQFPGVVIQGWEQSMNTPSTYCEQIGWPVFANTPSDIAKESADAVDVTSYLEVVFDIMNGGYIYYSIFERSFYLCACPSPEEAPSFNGPIFAGYSDNDFAKACVPATPDWLTYKRAHISELFTSKDRSLEGFFTHAMMPINGWVIAGFFAGLWPGATKVDFAAWNPGAMAYAVGPTFYADMSPIGFAAGLTEFSFASRLGAIFSQTSDSSGLPGNGFAGDVFACGYRNYSLVYVDEGGVSSNCVLPPAQLPDLFMNGKVSYASIDQQVWVAGLSNMPGQEMRLVSDMSIGDTPTSIELSSIVEGMPTSGTLVIGGEAFSYTGISGTSVTGVDRAIVSSAEYHYSGDVAMIGMWFLNINYTAIPIGHEYPGDAAPPPPDGWTAPWPGWEQGFDARVWNAQTGELVYYPIQASGGPTPPGPTVETTRPTVGTIWPRLAVYGSVKVIP